MGHLIVFIKWFITLVGVNGDSYSKEQRYTMEIDSLSVIYRLFVSYPFCVIYATEWSDALSILSDNPHEKRLYNHIFDWNCSRWMLLHSLLSPNCCGAHCQLLNNLLCSFHIKHMVINEYSENGKYISCWIYSTL